MIPAAVASRVRRNTELGLVVLAAVLTVGTYLLASLGSRSSLPANLIPFLGVILGLLAAAHVATRRLAPRADGMLLPLAGLLNGLGYVFIARLDPDLAGLQAIWTVAGVGAFVATLALIRRPRDLQRYRYTWGLVGVGLLMLPLLPVVGNTINDAQLWVRLGPLNFQPGEMAKLALCIFLASYLVDRQELLSQATRHLGPLPVPDAKHFGPLILAWGFSLVIMFWQRDLGSSLLFFALFISLVWVATGRVAYLGLGAVLFGAGAWFAWSSFTHVQDRVAIWLDPWATSDTTGFQLIQSLFAFAAGGVAGTNLGQGSPERIPAVTTDFAFAAIGEELGLLGTVGILVAYLLLIGAGLRVALSCDSGFTKLLATGLTAILGIQTFIILGGVTRLVPLTGITLPFVSYGGSSLLANYILLALLLRISDEQATRDAEREQ